MLDARQSPELQAALLAIKQARKDLKSGINKEARSKLKPIWTERLASKATSTMDRRAILPGARVTVSDRSIRAVAAGSRRKLSGGLVPTDDYGPLEWGAHVRKRAVTRRTRGGSVTYRATVNRSFRPWSKQGHVAMRAAGDLIAKAVAIWVWTVVDGLRGVGEVSR